MKNRIRNWRSIALTIILLHLSATTLAAQEIRLHQIAKVNGISIEPQAPGTFLIASYSGVFSISTDNRAQRITTESIGLSELVRHPEQPLTLFSSGYRSKTEKLGIVRSDDGGKTWIPLSKGAKGPIAFHAMAISPSLPSVLYGAEFNDELQVSKDGGRNWQIVGKTPGQVFDLAVSPSNPNRVYIATRDGLFKSDTGGGNWTPAHAVRRTATMVNISKDGVLRAFIYGYGLVYKKDEETRSWSKSSAQFSGGALMSMAAFPNFPTSLLGVSDTGVVFASKDNGETWRSSEGTGYASAERISTGRRIYEENCLTCHGAEGIGEQAQLNLQTGERELPLAPSLNDIGHTWHHSDEQLIDTILNGSSPNGRMPAWKRSGIDRKKAESLVAYIKSLWNFRSLSCQGPRHMTCLQ